MVIQDGPVPDDAALRWASKHARLVGADVETHRSGEAFRAQLVVIQGRTGSPLGLSRHVVPQVCDPTACDTVVLRGTPAALRGEHGRITALVSGGPDDLAVLDHAADFARRRGAALRVLHAAPLPIIRADLDEDHSRVLAHSTGHLGGFPHTAVLMRLHPHEAIARCTDTDLLVVGAGETHDCGAVTKAALHHAPCPVLVVHRPVPEERHDLAAIPAPRRPVRTTV
ncbi:hypothetical protein Lesp02_00990 [Lentzea sp. NBRC 105346]|nr:hypothetical protein Lesp02_00990 [Lentzea sp. NBRC 105346]